MPSLDRHTAPDPLTAYVDQVKEDIIAGPGLPKVPYGAAGEPPPPELMASLQQTALPHINTPALIVARGLMRCAHAALKLRQKIAPAT